MSMKESHRFDCSPVAGVAAPIAQTTGKPLVRTLG
jgi:hypothetical protein